MKRIFIIVIVSGVLLGSGYLYFWYQNLIKTNQEAQIAIPKAQKFDSIINSISSEQTRCKAFVGSGSGDFGQFEYCKRFLDWSAKLQE